ncbi:MAG: hypothetical protein NC347_12895 [Clostridium sp.]|nr:hypothetical protein [Clostridium sp.]
MKGAIMISFQKKGQNKALVIAGIVIFIIFISTIIVVLMKNNSKSTNGRMEENTGYENGIISQPQIMYNGEIYYYFATGFDEKLPEEAKYVGTVLQVDNTKEPENDFEGVQVQEGQKIYVPADDNSCLYVEYNEGECAVFSLSEMQ